MENDTTSAKKIVNETESSSTIKQKKKKPTGLKMALYVILALAGVYLLITLMIYCMLYAGRPNNTDFAEIFGISALIFPVALLLIMIGKLKK